MMFVHEQQDDRQGIKHMQANHRKHVEHVKHSSVFDLVDKDWNSFKLMDYGE